MSISIGWGSAPLGVVHGVTRDPFRFRARPAPVTRPTASAAPVVPVPTGPPPLPPIPLRFIGIIEPVQREGRVTMLSDGRGTVTRTRRRYHRGAATAFFRISADSLELAYCRWARASRPFDCQDK